MNTATYIVAGVALLGCVGAWLWFAGSEGINRINWRMNATTDRPDTGAAGASNVHILDHYDDARAVERNRRNGGGDAA